jgi:hypothetical protein
MHSGLCLMPGFGMYTRLSETSDNLLLFRPAIPCSYFGVSKAASRQERDDPVRNSELAAFDLQQQQLLWRREVRWLAVMCCKCLAGWLWFNPQSSSGHPSMLDFLEVLGHLQCSW